MIQPPDRVSGYWGSCGAGIGPFPARRGLGYAAHHVPRPRRPPVTPLRVSRGRPLPLGTTPLADGVNFALLCRHGTRVALVLSPADDNTPFAEVELHPRRHRTGGHWPVLAQARPGACR